MAHALLTVDDKAFTLASPPAGEAQIIWNGHPVATLKAGARLLAPEMVLDTGLGSLVPEIQQGVRERLGVWLKAQFERHIPALLKMEAGATDPEVPATARAVLAQLADAGGIMPRTSLDEALAQVAKDDRTHLRKSGVIIGVMDLYHPGLMKPAAAQWRMALLSLKREKPLVALPAPGVVLIPASDELDEVGARIAGFRKLGDVWLRIDMVERLARGAHEAIAAGKPYGAEDPTIVSIGLNEASFLDLMRQAGFRPVPDAAEDAPNWQFKGRPKPRVRPEGERRNRAPARRGQAPVGAGQDGAVQAEAGQGADARKPRPERDRGGDRARPERSGNRPDRKPRSADSERGGERDSGRDRDRDRGPARPIVATGKALAGLGALFGRED